MKEGRGCYPKSSKLTFESGIAILNQKNSPPKKSFNITIYH